MAVALDPEAKALQLAAEAGVKRLALYYQPLGQEQSFSINPNEPFHAASTMKVPVMMEAIRQDIQDSITIKNSFTSLADGHPYSLEPENDSDPSLYGEIGKQWPVDDLIERMIVRSSNLATNLLIEKLGAGKVQEMLDQIGCGETKVLRGVEDNRAYQAGRSNTVTAGSLGRILLEIAEGSYFKPEERERMMGILCRQEHRQGIPAGLPQAKRIGNKTGWFTGTFHDAAIVEMDGERKFVLVALTEGLDEPQAFTFVARLAEMSGRGEFG